MKSLDVLKLVLLHFTLNGVTNIVHAVEVNHRMLRSTVTRVPKAKGSLNTPYIPSTNAVNGLNSTKTHCNGSECTTSPLDILITNRAPIAPDNKTIIDKMLDELSQFKYVCLAYGQPSLVKLKIYDPHTQICCNGLFNRTTPTESCCHGEIIDGDTEVCCGDRRISRSDYISCCRDVLYDTNSTICCDGTLFPRTKYSTCCGDRVISAISEICCSDRTFPKTFGDEECCGDGVYSKQTGVCCNGTIQPTIGQHNEYGSCCGAESYDTRCFICTFSEDLIPIANSTLNDTCCYGKITEHEGRKVCCVNGSTERSCLHINGEIKPRSLDSKSEGHLIVITVTGLTVFCVAVGTCVGVYWRKRCKHQRCKPIWSEQRLLSTGVDGCIGEDDEHRTVSRQAEYAIFENSYTNKQADDIRVDTSKQLQEEDNRSVIGSSRHDVSMYAVDSEDIESGHDIGIEELNYHQAFEGISLGEYVNTIKKDVPSHKGNKLVDHFKDIGCQTTSKEKPCNRRTILGNNFEHSAILDMNQPTFTMPQSEVRVRLPDCLLRQHPVEMHGSSFDSLSSVHGKININSAQEVASPVVEYVLTGVPEMEEHAVVTMPYLGKEADLKVFKFRSDDGMQTKADPVEVPRKTKENNDMPLFYEIQGNFVKIYTRSFSGFFITTKKHNRDACLNLRTFLFGSYKRFPQYRRSEVRLMLYIADEIMTFKDYRKEMYRSAETEGKFLLKDTKLKLTDEVKEDDFLNATIRVMSEESHWMHRLLEGDIPIHKEIKWITFRDLVAKCPDCPNCHFERRDMPYMEEWYLTNTENGSPSDVFQCVVNVKCIGTGKSEQNSITIDELRLREEDRLPQMESNEGPRLEEMKRFLVNMEDRCQQKFVEIIQRKYDCRGERITEVLHELHRTMKTVGIYETVVNTLQLGQMDTQLRSLQNKGILEDKYFPKPVQRTGVDASDMVHRPSVQCTPANHQGRSANGQPFGQRTDASNVAGAHAMFQTENERGASKLAALNIKPKAKYKDGNANCKPVPVKNPTETMNIVQNPIEEQFDDSQGCTQAEQHQHVTHAYYTGQSEDDDNAIGANGLGMGINMTNGICRNELGSDLPVCSYPREDNAKYSEEVENAKGLVGDHDHVEPGMTERLQLLEMTDVKHTVPVQEHASLEETHLKLDIESESDEG